MVRNDIDYKIAMLVVRSYWHVDERISKLEELGYIVSYIWVRRGRVGAIRRYAKRDGVQVSGSVGGNRFVGCAYVAFKR